MHLINNLLFTPRINTTSTVEQTADWLLTPARILFGERKVFVFQDGAVYAPAQQEGSVSSNEQIETARKILALITLPLAAVGAALKLTCLSNQKYRNFCTKKIPEHPLTYPKRFEKLLQHVHETADFVLEQPGMIRFKPLGLFECSCENGAFHRLKSPRRNRLEQAIVERLAQHDTNQPIRLLSMGSGGLMSDFLTLEKLVLAGFKKISIDCVDTAGIHPDQLENIRKFFAEYPEVTLDIQGYQSIDLLPAEKTNYAALLAIDYNALASFDDRERLTCTADLMKAYRRLAQDGFIGLGFSDEDTLFGPQMEPIVLSSQPSITCTLAADMTQRLVQKEELLISLPTIWFAGASHIFMLSLSFALEQSARRYNKISLSCLEKADNETLLPFQAMMQALFPTSTIEISAHEQDKTYDLLFTGSLEEEFRSKQYLSFLNPESTAYIMYPEGKIVRQNYMQRHGTIKIWERSSI
jgi:hypothetical protein